MEVRAIQSIVYGTGGFPWELLLRLALATFCGCLIGRERSLGGQDAGVRTHAILALATAAFMITSIHGFWDYTDKGAAGLGGYDPSMIAHQVVNGVAFMGAGLIFKSKHSGVSGMATAAGIWLTAAIGLACGGGLYATALFCTVLTVVMQHYLDLRVPFTFQKIEIVMENSPAAWRLLERKRRKWKAEIVHSSYQRQDEELIRLQVMLKLQKPIPFEESLYLFNNHPEIKKIST